MPLGAIRWARWRRWRSAPPARSGRWGGSARRAYGEGTPAATRGALVFRVGVAALGAVLLLCLKRWLFR